MATLALALLLVAALVAGGYAFGLWMRAWNRGDLAALPGAALVLATTWLAVGMLGAKVLQLLGGPR